MIEAGDIGHNGLFIGPQRTHDVYTSPQHREENRKREVESESPKAAPPTRDRGPSIDSPSPMGQMRHTAGL